MIFILLLNTIYIIVYTITSPLRLLPDVTLPQQYLDSISTANGYITPINTVFPVDTLLNILGLLIIIELAYLGYKFIMWLIRRIPTQS